MNEAAPGALSAAHDSAVGFVVVVASKSALVAQHCFVVAVSTGSAINLLLLRPESRMSMQSSEATSYSKRLHSGSSLHLIAHAPTFSMPEIVASFSTLLARVTASPHAPMNLAVPSRSSIRPRLQACRPLAWANHSRNLVGKWWHAHA